MSFPLDDKTAWRHAAVMLYLTDAAPQVDIAREWDVTPRTVNGWVRTYREKGVVALVARGGRPVMIGDTIKRSIVSCHQNRVDVNETAR